MAADRSLDPRARPAPYDDAITRAFVWATIVDAVLVALAGAWLALELAHPAANVAPALGYGRLRALHSDAAVLAFACNALFAVVYHVAQRALRVRIAWPFLAWSHFALWQAAVAAAALGPLFGFTQGREQAEPVWPVALAIAVAWALFATVLFGTVARRREPRLAVAVWFFLASVLAFFAWHVVGNAVVPLDALRSVPVAGGARDAVLQSWCAQNAAEFMLTVPLVGAMYWIVPRVADAPIWSYRLAVLNFWSLLAAYLFAGARPLLDTAVPDRVAALAVVSGVMLWAPGWAAVINGMATLASRWSAIRGEPVARFFAAALGFLGLATLESALLAMRDVDAVAHYTSWTDAHTHVTALGWTGLAVAGALHWIVPALAARPLHSRTLAMLQLYLCIVGTALYLVASWTAGGTEGSMWREVTPAGELAYPSFLETVRAVRPLFAMRALGGGFYLLGMLAMLYNFARTAWSGRAAASSPAAETLSVSDFPGAFELLTDRPMVVLALTGALGAAAMAFDESAALLFAVLALGAAVVGSVTVALSHAPGVASWHERLEHRAAVMTLLIGALVVGSLAIGLQPALALRYPPALAASVSPLSPLELAGRRIYLREGCSGCHTQMVRPFAYEAVRYGDVSRTIDSRYDHPAVWGVRRTGPDLAHEGGRYPGSWHFLHLVDPSSLSPGSVMPSYAALVDRPLVLNDLGDELRALRSLGVPYSAAQLAGAPDAARAQARSIVRDLALDDVRVAPDREVVALIAYLQRLGLASSPRLP